MHVSEVVQFSFSLLNFVLLAGISLLEYAKQVSV